MSRRPVSRAEAAAARAYLAAAYVPCHSCGNQQAGPLHRTSEHLWRDRAERARANDGTDPVSGVSLAEAERHLDRIAGVGAGSPS
jgi:hypothetical protein